MKLAQISSVTILQSQPQGKRAWTAGKPVHVGVCDVEGFKTTYGEGRSKARDTAIKGNEDILFE